MLRGGYLTLGRISGVPVSVHWTAPLVPFVLSRFRLDAGFFVGFFVLIVVHELGHAWMVKRRGLITEEIALHGLGGHCRYSGYPTPVDRSVIAWGGVLAQMVLLVATLAVRWTVGWPGGAFMWGMADAFVDYNLLVMGLNLIPFPPLDGAEAWKLFGLLKERRRQKRMDSRRRAKAAARREAWAEKRGRGRGRGTPSGDDAGVPEADLGAVNDSIRDALREAAREAARKRRREEEPR